ncbi:hypothetical protein ACFYNM_10090 [Streptomyces spororaveus]|uniref:hypothetical protein n=1 Tax=Streptomyces spororaveus TaxID=284039 RepID=UPI0036CBB19A
MNDRAADTSAARNGAGLPGTVANGDPALALHLDGELDGVTAIRLEDPRMTGISRVRNPRKPVRVASETSPTLR